MSHCDAGVPVEVKIYLSQKIFQLFSKQVFSIFQDFEIILREKNFSDFQTNLSPGIAVRFQRHKLRFTCNQRRRTLPGSLLGSHGKGTGARVFHCDAGVPVEVKIFLSQKIFSTFFKTGFLHVSGL